LQQSPGEFCGSALQFVLSTQGDVYQAYLQLERDACQKMKWSNEVEKRKFSRGKPVEDKKAIDRGHLGRKSAKLAKRAKLSQKRAQAKVEELKSTRPFVPRPLRLCFPEYQVQSRPFLQAHGLSFGFDGTPLFEGVNVELTTRSRVGLVGPNGCAKTTLLRCLLGKLSPSQGEVHRHTGVRVFFLPQNLLGFFRARVLLDNLLVYGVDQAKVRNILGSALIRGESVFQLVETLSGGQRMRVAIVASILAKADFLVLDEPTAHLDIESRQVLDEMLEAFPGGLLFVSHDRHFIARHAQTTYTMYQGQWQRLGFEWTLPPVLEPLEGGKDDDTEVQHE
ncbi:MAG TPA: ATP-binding cassette domain-containing protein, partial [Thermotogota bacterium]|nr:ATP-binding cassette domain-containing protein [Thermotogota bacterium]